MFKKTLTMLAIVTATMAVNGAQSSTVAQAAPNEPRGITIVLSPHPDDEGQIYGKLKEQNPNDYTIVFVATQGDGTVHCKDGILKNKVHPELGNVVPPYNTFTKGSAGCVYNRLYLFNKNMDESAAVTPVTSIGKLKKSIHMGNNAQLWIGDKGARASLNLGDGQVTRKEFAQQVQNVLYYRGTELPWLPIKRIIATGYYNGPLDKAHHSDLAMEYNHPDHLEVVKAAEQLAKLSLYGADIVTHPFDKRATMVSNVTTDEYDYLMGVSQTATSPIWHGWEDPVRYLNLQPGNTGLPAGVSMPVFSYTNNKGLNTFSGFGDKPNPIRYYHRRGVFQKNYGWLAFPGPWTPGKYQLKGSDTLMPQYSFFYHVKGQQR